MQRNVLLCSSHDIHSFDYVSVVKFLRRTSSSRALSVINRGLAAFSSNDDVIVTIYYQWPGPKSATPPSLCSRSKRSFFGMKPPNVISI